MDREQIEKGLQEHLKELDGKLEGLDSLRAERIKTFKALQAFQGIRQAQPGRHGEMAEKAFLVIQASPEGISSGQLAERIGCNKTTISYHLQKLLNRGDVVRRGNATMARWYPRTKPEPAFVADEKTKKSKR